jgi:hypothetical protein
MNKFNKLVNNKTIALVGNSTSLFDTEYGKEIDSHDIVIRMNKAAIFYPEICSISHGEKMDAWCFWTVGAFSRSLKEDKNIPDKMVRAFYDKNSTMKFQACVNGHKTYTERYIDETFSSGLFNNLKRNLNIISEQDNAIYPSLGITVLRWLTYNSIKNISVYGFDWKTTPTFSEKELFDVDMEDRYDKRCKHDFIAEEIYFYEELFVKNKKIVLRQ